MSTDLGVRFCFGKKEFGFWESERGEVKGGNEIFGKV